MKKIDTLLKACDESLYYPLICASENGRMEIVEYLISKDADINLKDQNGCTPLLAALSHTYLPLEYGNQKRTDSQRASDFQKITELLVLKGADANTRADSGETALHGALISNYINEKIADVDPKWTFASTIICGIPMANDHYVAQTYLKNFTDSEGMLIPYFKSGREAVGKPKSPKSVCYVPDGSSNSYFSDPRILEKFLTPLENNWNDNLEGLVNSTAKFMASRGQFHNAKFSQEFKDEMVERVMNDEFSYTVNQEYAHAKNIAILDQLPITLCSSYWKILLANGDKFLTSDNPLCLYYPADNPMVGWWYAPLKPNMALLIRPDPEHSEIIKERRYDELPDGNVEYGKIKQKFIFTFNQNLVRHAEKKVFFNQKADWVSRLVKLNRN